MDAAQQHALHARQAQPLMLAWLEKFRARFVEHGLAVPTAPAFDASSALTAELGEPILSFTTIGGAWHEAQAELAAVDATRGLVVLCTLVFRTGSLPTQQPGLRTGFELLMALSVATTDEDAALCQVFEVAPDESTHCAVPSELHGMARRWVAEKLTDDKLETLFDEVLDVLVP